MKVDEQSELPSTKLQIAEELSVMVRKFGTDCFADYCSEFASQSSQSFTFEQIMPICANRKFNKLHRIRAERTTESLFLRYYLVRLRAL